MIDWTEERVALLKKLWIEQGLTATECGLILHVSRNSVLSKVHRSGFPLRLATKQPKPAIEPRERKKRHVRLRPLFVNQAMKSPYTPPMIPAPPTSAPIKLVDLTGIETIPGQCRWPVSGDKELAMFCGAPRQRAPYCPYHSRAAHAK